MNMNVIRGLALGTVALGLVGCTVYVHGDPPPASSVVVEERYVPPPPPPAPPPPPPASEIVLTDDDEVNFVVYREYFGCSEAEIYTYPHYRRYYGVSDDDLYFITFVARQRGVAFDVCFRNWYTDCGRNDDRLVVTYNVPRSAFFCSGNVGVTTYPPIYQRTYAAYHQNTVASLTIQNSEYVALVHMKVGVDYQGHPPATFFAEVNAHGGNTGKVIVANRDSCGKGGVSATGARVTVSAPRPWTMPPAQKQAWHDEHKAQVVKHEATFKQVHPEQVKKVQSQSPQKSAAGLTTSPKPTPKPGAQAPKTEARPAPGAAPEEKHSPAEEDRRGQKQAPGAPGAKSPSGEVEPKGPKPSAPPGQGPKPPSSPEGHELKREEQNKRSEGSRQPTPKESEKEKGKSEEEEKKGGK